MGKVVDLDQFRNRGIRVLAGRDKGRSARNRVNLDNLDRRDEVVLVRVPLDVHSLNSSFFLGMFGDSVRALGEDRFRQHYIFEGADVSDVVNRGIKRALSTGQTLPQP